VAIRVGGQESKNSGWLPSMRTMIGASLGALGLAGVYAWANYGLSLEAKQTIPPLNAGEVTPLSLYALGILREAGSYSYQIACATTVPWILAQVNSVIESFRVAPSLHAPEAIQTQALGEAPMKVATAKLGYFPGNLEKQAMLEAAVKDEPWRLSWIGQDEQTQVMVESAMQADPYYFQYVRKDLQTAPMVQRIVEADPSQLLYVRDGLRYLFPRVQAVKSFKVKNSQLS